jgi:ketosteroid isomerase-like protein
MRRRAKEPNDLEKLFVQRANAGDVDGLVALYEPDAVVACGNGEVAIGHKQIRGLFVRFLAEHPRLDPSIQTAALCSGDLALTSSRTGNGDVTAEIARRQRNGSWLWVVDQFALVHGKTLCGPGLERRGSQQLRTLFHDHGAPYDSREGGR